MKPIHLSLSGLHSFREKQDIHFSSLCEGGVFGIFGPTGSGKSSILDAMTLALYGKVERALNNTQGIINHAENEIHVSFTFELENAKGCKRYKVDRSFKRNGDIQVRTVLCRFIELSDPPFVLADKTNEVAEKIEALLGLTHEDFTRAVVLPQGRFAEFLTLKGSDRRQMLQRLFHLEKYGDRLTDRVRLRIQSLKSKEEKLQAEQQGLGDASLEKVQEWQQRLKEIEQKVLELEQRRKELEESHSTKQQIWNWQMELIEVEKEGERLKAKKEAIIELEKKWEHSSTALKLKPSIEEYQEASLECQLWNKKKEKVDSALLVKKQEEAEHAQKLQEWLRERDEQQPILQEYQSVLRYSMELLREMKELEKEILPLEQLVSEYSNQKQEWTEHYQKTCSELDIAYQLQNTLQREEEALTISFAERTKVGQACQEKKEISFLLKQKEEGDRELLVKQSEFIQVVERENQLNSKLQECQAQLESAAEKILEEHRVLHSIQSKLETEVYRAEEEHLELEKQWEKEKEEQLAVQLRERLQSGEPCPVCGSKDHPLDHMNKLEHMNKRTQRNFNIEYVEEHKKRIEQAKHSLFKLDTLKIALEQQLTELTEVGEGQEIKLSSIVQHTVLLSCQETAVSLEKECEPTSSHSIQESIEHVNLRYERGQILQEEGRKIRKLFQETAREWRELSAQLTNIRKEIAQRERKLELLGQEINVKKEQWIASFAPYSYQEIEALQQEVEIKDQKVEKLKERLEKSRLYIDEREGKKQKAQEQMNQIQLLMTEKASLLKEKKDLIGRKERQIKEQAGTLEIEATLQKVTEKLQEWRNKEQELSQVWHQLREELQQLEREESVANESLKQATARKHKSEEGWNQQLRESLFSSLEEVERALVSTKDMESWKAELDAYRSEETKWALEQSRIQSLLKGQSITEEDWEQWNRARKEMIEKVSEANQEHGATKAILADIQMKHERYLELEEQRRQVVQQKEMHLQLQRVLKGNAFVEYVAQEQLMRVSRDASQRLGLLSRQRYALEVDSNGGFVIRDDANGGVKRPVTSLSGGETFLTSLALALALSAQIQLRGEYPLEFFFLDEGFGTLDQELLETVVSALEQLHTERLAVGVISHVPELRSRLARRLIVEPAEPSGRGSVVHLETM